ncbi:cell division protein FtsQ/DivIB [Actinomyces timonensis]|uniref:cell division protein FtsQ/DivIB n=1 Tax=Actinomyces timonensis TaxID=1288391 RepID=UPI0002DBE4DE|nr:FtsQ-type POTRA domain-containing protein [Actinomyces timonensis]
MRRPHAPRPAPDPAGPTAAEEIEQAERTEQIERVEGAGDPGKTGQADQPRQAQQAPSRTAASSASSADSGSTEVATRAEPGSMGRLREHAASSVVSTGLTDRLAERRRAARSLRARRLTSAIVVLLIIAAIAWAVLYSPLLALRPQSITVEGTDGAVSASEVQEVLASHTGESLVRLDVDRLGGEVANGLVRVRSATVTRSWPHGLTVSLELRTPVAVQQTDDGYAVLDSEAVVLETVTEAPAGLALLAAEGAAEGSAPPLNAAQVATMTAVVGSLDGTTRQQVSQVTISTTGQVSLSLVGGASVVWGDGSQNALKAQVLTTLLTTQASVYDVSAPHNPTTR